MKGRLKQEKGFITIEAVISLSSFMFVIVTLLTVVNICLAQARIAVAINSTAKELSQYSYLYSLTGFSKSEKELKEQSDADLAEFNSALSDINTVFNEIENLGNTGKSSINNVEDITAAWDSAVGSAENIEKAGASLEKKVEEIAKDPKQLIFGIAKLAASEGLELAKSRLIAAPLAKVLCRKHLVDEKGGDTEAFLKQIGVVPGASGSYMDGLDFSHSTLFPYGSNEITVNVSYNVKVITLLPIDFTFHFNQTAITHGWLAGEESYTSSEEAVETKMEDVDSIWTKSTVQERSALIRNLGIKDLKKEGYLQFAGSGNIELYNPDKNEFLAIRSMNPLYSGEGEDALTLDDISDEAIREQIERLCGSVSASAGSHKTVTTKKQLSNGNTEKKEVNCEGASCKIVLVVPEDEGLKEKIESIIASSNTNGVTIEVVADYGKGARQTAVKPAAEEQPPESGQGGTGE